MLPVSGNPTYYVEDLLGTSRVLTSSTGVPCYDADFYPYGGERAYLNTCPQNYKFEGKERDSETGNDDFGARYYSNRFGRWLSADWSAVPAPIPYANLTNPQTLNLYSMVSDDPETFADLDGHCDWCQKLKNVVTGRGWLTDKEYASAVNWYNGLGAGEKQIIDRQIQETAQVVFTVGGTTVLGLASEPSGGTDTGASNTETEQTSEDAALASRAQEIQGAQDAFGQTKSTTAVGSVTNADGTTETVVSSSRATLTPSQRAALKPGETAVRGSNGVHAEQKILDSAAAKGQTVNGIAPSRPPCSNCSSAMQNGNVRTIHPGPKPPTPKPNPNQ